MIVLSLESPMKMMEQLRDWFSALSNQLFKMFPDMAEGALEDMKRKIVKMF